MATYNIVLTPNTDVDQSVSCQAQINAVPDGTAGTPNIINLPAGRYRIDRGISLNVRKHLRLTCLAGISKYPNPPTASDVFFAYTDLWAGDLFPPPSGDNTGLKFDGVNDHVTFGATMGTANFTIETWFNWDGGGVATSIGGLPSVIPLVAKGRNETNYLLGIDVSNPATPKLVGAFEEGSGGTTPGLIHSVVGPNTILTDAWYHVAVTYDGTTLKLYRSKTGYPSGASEDWGTLAVGQPSASLSADHAALGSALTSTGVAAGFFAGSMDEVRIWNVARTPAQIEATWDKEVSTGTGLIGRWGLNDATGTIADGTPGPNGILTNGPTWAAGASAINKPSRAHFSIGGCTNVVGSFLAIDGPMTERSISDPRFGQYSTTRYNDHGFRIGSGGANGWTPDIDCGFEDCYATNVWGDGVSMGGPNISTSDPVLGMSNTNLNLHVRRFLSTYAGRHGINASCNDGLELTDVYADWAGLAGMDIEPNGDWQICWNVDMTRVSVGGRDGGFSFSGGSGTQPYPLPPRKKNIRMTDCTVLHEGAGGLKASGGGWTGNAGYFIVDGFTDLVSNKTVGVTISGFDDITVKNSRISTVSPATNSVAIQASARNSFTATNNNCNGLASDGFDILYTCVIPGTSTPTPNISHYGNVWAMGTQNDGGAPSAPSGPVAQTLPSLRQAATGTSGTTVSGAIAATLPSLQQAATGAGVPLPPLSFAKTSGQFAGAPFGHIQFADAGSEPEGVIASTLPSLTQSATGTHGTAVSGSVAQTLPSLTQATTAAAEVAAIVASVLPSLTQSSTGSLGIDAIIAQTLPSLVGTGVGSEEIFGGITSTLPSLTQSAAVTMEIEATITSTLPSLSSQGQIFIGLLPTDRIPETRVVRVWSEYRSLKGASVPGKSWSR